MTALRAVEPLHEPIRRLPARLRRSEIEARIRAEALRLGLDVEPVLADWSRLAFRAGISEPERPFRLYQRREVERLMAEALLMARLRRPTWTAALGPDGRVTLTFDPGGLAPTWTSAAATARYLAREARAQALAAADTPLPADLLAHSLGAKPRTLRRYRARARS